MALLQISEPGLSGNPHKRNIAIGIDLGTTNSLVATIKNATPTILSNEQQEQLIPSVVYYGKNNEISVGDKALEMRALDPANTIISVKRFMGKSLTDLDQNIIYPYQFTDTPNIIEVNTNAGIKNPIQISSAILHQLKQIAEQNLGDEIFGAVITVPAYFDESQRQATKQAAQLSGLNVLRLLNEPTAAAIAYGLDNNPAGIFLVYDLGGGTLDVSILRLNKGIFEVLAVSGDTNLGGDDFDHLIYQHILQQNQIDQLNHEDNAKLMNLAKRIKEQLSVDNEIITNLELSNGKISIKISQTDFLVTSKYLLDRALLPIKKALRDAKLNLNAINDIILVGGSTRMPQIRNSIKNLFGKEPLADLDPDKVVALGAAIQANILAGNKLDDDWLLLDVTPLSLGIETMGNLVEKIIPRNSTIPITKAQDFTTYKDGQTAMSIHVLQGERELVFDCRSLAKFILRGIPPMVAGAARVRIMFQIDADGLLSVSATELTTGTSSSVSVKPSFGLDENQIREMLQQSISNAKSDVLQRQLAEASINAESLVSMLQNALKSDGELLNTIEKSTIEETIQQLINTLHQELEIVAKTTQIKQLTTHLDNLTQDFAAKRMNKTIQAGLTGKNINNIK